MSSSSIQVFETAYSAAYKPAKEILQEIYDEVASGNEIRSVVMHSDRLKVGRQEAPACHSSRSHTRLRDMFKKSLVACLVPPKSSDPPPPQVL